jgi:hypothetical protein
MNARAASWSVRGGLAHPHHLSDAARLVDLRLQYRLHVPSLGPDHW